MGKTFRKERTKPKEHTKKPIKRCKKVDSNDLANTISPDWDLEEDFTDQPEPLFGNYKCFCEDTDISHCGLCYTMTEEGQLVHKETGESL